MRPLLLLPAALLACGIEPCPTATCPEQGLAVALDHAAWDDGVWTLHAEIDGTTYDCTFTLPATTIEGQYCGNGGRLLIRYDTTAGAPVDLWITGEDTTDVTVALSFGGATVTDQALPFDWEKDYINGPGCPPACLSATATLTF